MTRFLLSILGAAALVAALSSPVLAQDVKVHDSGSTDSGTCGNDWANDTFNRDFKVTQQADGSFVLTEYFRDGHFVTIDGISPGACQSGTDHGTLISGGVGGTFHGFIAGPVTGGTYNPGATCPDPCNGATFVAAFFGAGAVWSTPDFYFQYEAEGGNLAFRRWTNASSGNVGDIATS